MRRSNTTRCPIDGEPLHWEIYLGIRITRSLADGTVYYETKCPKCNRHWQVAKQKDKKK